MKGFEKRYLFKRAFRNLLPAEVLQKKKHGFGIPVAVWLKSDRRLREFSRDILFSSRATQRGYFRREFLDDLIRKHEADDSTYYGDTLWSFFVLELWHRQFVDDAGGCRGMKVVEIREEKEFYELRERVECAAGRVGIEHDLPHLGVGVAHGGRPTGPHPNCEFSQFTTMRACCAGSRRCAARRSGAMGRRCRRWRLLVTHPLTAIPITWTSSARRDMNGR